MLPKCIEKRTKIVWFPKKGVRGEAGLMNYMFKSILRKVFSYTHLNIHHLVDVIVVEILNLTYLKKGGTMSKNLLSVQMIFVL